jgi:hypothetical protein
VGGRPDDRKSSNLRAILTIMASGADSTGCVNMNVTEEAGGVEAYRSAFASQCSIVSEYNADNLRLSPAAGGDSVWIKLTAGESPPGAFPLGDPVAVSVNVSSYEDHQDAYAYPTYDAICE